MFKLGMSLVFAVLAALMVLFSGLIADVRVLTILLRMLAAFLCAGIFVYLVAFLLEAKGIVGFDKDIFQSEELEDVKKEAEEAAEGEADASADGEGAEAEAAEKAEEGFAPLEGNVTHLETPPNA